MMPRLLDRLAEGPLIADGAMGTQLFLAGLEQGHCGDAWNLAHPDRVLAIQREYVDAGSDCLLTNTFGASRLMLARHGHAADAAAINAAGVRIAREALGGRPGFVIGDIGPFGGFLEPIGDAREADVRAAFEEQARALAGAGADAIIIETQTALDELGLALRAAREAGVPCVIGSMAYDATRDGANFRTMMGVDPERAVAFMQDAGADIVALNCGTGMDMARAREAVERYRRVTDLPIMVQPNAGQPVLAGMRVVYLETPEHMAEGVVPLVEAGARIVGGCCGSTPDHIRAFRRALDGWSRGANGVRPPQARRNAAARPA